MNRLFTLLLCSFTCFVSAQEGWPADYNLKDELFSNSFDKYEHRALFRPYIMSAPFVDSTSNLYVKEDVTAQFNAYAPRLAKERIDPATIYPIFTADRNDRFIFIVDMPSMTKTQEDSCYAFLAHFRTQLKDGEYMDVFRWGENKEFCSAEPQQIAVTVPPLDSEDPNLWNTYPYNPEWDPQIRKHDLSWAIDFLIASKGQSSTGYPKTNLPVTLSHIFVYMGNTGNYSGAHSEMTRVNTSCRANVRYLAVIDLDQSTTENSFRTMASYAGANPMPLHWGNETVAEYVLFRLVEHYEFLNPDEKDYSMPPRTDSPWSGIAWKVLGKDPAALPPSGASR